MAGEFDLKDFGLCSYSVAGGEASPGLALDGRVIGLKALAARVPDGDLYLSGTNTQLLQQWDRALPLLRQAAALFRASDDLRALSVPVDQVRLHSPVEAPRAIYCAGANYRKHVVEIIIDRFKPPGHETMTPEELRRGAEAEVDARAKTGEPFFFTKNLLALSGPTDDVILPALANETDWELELGVVIGRRAWCVSEAEALDHVAGYAVAHDVSTRDRMFRPNAVGADFLQAKGLASFFPFGPYLVPRDFVDDPQDLRILLKLNGQPMQDESTSDMVTPVAKLIAYLAKWVPLQPGDIIATGSPAGNGTHHGRFLKLGDVMEGSVSGLGVQVNRIVPEARP